MSSLAIVIVYTLTILISIGIALLLVYLARLSGQAGINVDKKTKIAAAVIAPDELINKAIAKEISEAAGSPERSEELAKRVADVFNKELEKKVSLSEQALAKKYEIIVEEKKQSEEIAWRKYKKVLTEKKDTEAVIRSIAQGLIVVDKSGKVMMMNPAAEQLLGASKKDKIGRNVLENLKQEQLVSLARPSTRKEDKEIELFSPRDETKKILRASTAVIENENGQTVGMVSVLSDITKQKELDELKANFVANVSHELRTPLVAMEKSISLILSKTAGPLTEAQGQFLTIAQRNIKRLSRLIDDLLDLSKLEAGKMELKEQLSSLGKLIDESVESFDTWAKQKSVKIITNIHEGLPLANLDPDRVTQVLNNLLGNAIKFTPNDGNITVEAMWLKEKKEIKVSVADNGIGIDQENLAKVFDKFYSGGERISTDISGTGIGLSVAKEIVVLHGGKIWAESQKGEGAKFIFTLPLKPEGNGLASHSQSHKPEGNGLASHSQSHKPEGLDGALPDNIRGREIYGKRD